MRTSSPRNALAFLGDKLQAKRDEVFLEEYRKQAHAALAKDPYSTSFSEDPDIIHKMPVVRSTIKYRNQSPGDGSSFSASSQLLYYSPVNPSAEHGRSSNSPRRRQREAQGQDPSGASPRGSNISTSPRRSMLSRTSTSDMLSQTGATDMPGHTAAAETSGRTNAADLLGRPNAADKTQGLSARMHMAAILTSRSIHGRDRSSASMTPHTPATASTARSGDATGHWTSVHWDTDMENKGTMQPQRFTSQKAVHARAPRLATAPTQPLSRTLPTRPSESVSSMTPNSNSDSDTDSGAGSDSADSDSDESVSEAGSAAESESRLESRDASSRAHQSGGSFLSDYISWDQLPDRCMRDRCLRPLSKLQQQTFMPSGQAKTPKAQPEGLIWQNSGFMTPFNPELLTLKRGQSKQISTAATGVTTGLVSGASVPPLHFQPSMAGPAEDAQRLPSSESRQSSSVPVRATSSASAAAEAPAAPGGGLSSASLAQAPRASPLMQPVSETALSELAQQQLQQQPAALKHAAAFGRSTMQLHREGDEVDQGDADGVLGSSQGRKNGKRRKKNRRHSDPAMSHIEEHLRILKHVHVKRASPRTMMTNRLRAEQLGFAALPATLSRPMSATLGSATLGHLETAPVSRPVSGQGGWYKTGMHVLPEELNAAVLEALAAEAAGVSIDDVTPEGRPTVSPTASYKMRMEAHMKAMVYDDALDAANAAPKRVPAINPNRAYLKSLAQGSAKKHFQSVEVDLREAHRRLLATTKDLQPVTYAAAAKTHVYAC